MTLSAGTRLGPYEILSPLGAGGMGEVYKARDTRLNRGVAVKVLSSHLSASAELRQRFEREAKTISQLSHPHICTLYDVGREGETEYLVMELLEGETLLDRLAKGPLPLDQTLRYGVEIADALDKAHRQGIVHRDLKPSNVMLTGAGVKLLDFGLAKSISLARGPSSSTKSATVAGSDNVTREGSILGTLPYMAPEQLEGKEADTRTDVFALGAVLYEMATGKAAFSGTSQASLISAIMKEDPAPISTLRPLTPAALDRALRACIAKAPDDRWQSTADLARELRWIAEQPDSSVTLGGGPGRRAKAGLAVAVALGTLAAAAFGVILLRPHPAAPQSFRFSISEPRGTYFSSSASEVGGAPALSPDGRWLVFSATDNSGKNQLWIRGLDSVVAHPLAGTDNAIDPFWSPDSRLIGFFSDYKLLKVDVGGGSPEVLCQANLGSGGTWSGRGEILYSDRGGVLRVVSATGGASRALWKEEANSKLGNFFPFFLPDGDHFLYVASGVDSRSGNEEGIFVGSLTSLSRTRVSKLVSRPVFSSGHILLVDDGKLFAIRFDARRRLAEGDPVLIVDPAAVGERGWVGVFTASREGLLAYQASQAGGVAELVWFERSGKREGSVGERRPYRNVVLSPDGRRVAVEVESNAGLSILVLDATRGLDQRLTPAGSYAGSYNDPIWSPDATRIAYTAISLKPRHGEVRVKEVTGAGRDVVLVEGETLDWIGDWSPDGSHILATRLGDSGGRGNFSLQSLSVADGKWTTWLETDSNERDPAFSPDGRWVAYGSDESGPYEIYVRPFAGPGGKWQISRGTGTRARWRRDGKELYYVSPDGKMMAVEIHVGPAGFDASAPRPLFDVPLAKPVVFPAAPFSVTPDGQRFLIATPVGEITAPPVTVVVNWPEALLKR
jgi:serine/threonine protein kinase